MGRAYGYARASEPRYQIHSGDRQEHHIERYAKKLCAQEGLEWMGVLVEEVSGSKVDFRARQKGGYLYKAMRDGDHLIVQHLDRLGRSLGDIHRTVEVLSLRGIVLHVLQVGGSIMDGTDPTISRMLLSFLAFAAEWESHMISRRVKDWVAWRIHEGKPLSRRSSPAGFRVRTEQDLRHKGRIRPVGFVPEPRDQETVRLAHRLWKGGMSVKAIVRRFRERDRRSYSLARIDGRPCYWSESRLAYAVKAYEEHGETMFELKKALQVYRKFLDREMEVQRRWLKKRRLKRLQAGDNDYLERPP